MQPQQEPATNELKRSQPMSQTIEAELQSAPKKRRTIEDALKAAGLEPGTSSASTTGSIMVPSSSKPAIATYTSPYHPYSYPPASTTQPATNGYANYQFNNYYNQTTYPLIGILLSDVNNLSIANYYNYNIVGTDHNLGRTQYAPSMYQTIQQATKIYSAQPPPPSAVPPTTTIAAQSTVPSKPAAPVQVAAIQRTRKSPWGKAPAEKSATILKALDRIASAPKGEKAKQDILEDKTLPDSVRKFIVRGYAKCYTEMEKDYMRNLLRQVVEMSKVSGQILTKKWDEMELPKLPREIQHPTLTIPAKHGSASIIAVNNIPGVPSTIPSPSKILFKPPAAAPPKPVSQEEAQRRNERKTRFSQQQAQPSDFSNNPIVTASKNGHKGNSSAARTEDDPATLDFGIKGTCTKLEKEYFRLSGAPDPSTVRPEEVLKKTLKMLKQKWKTKAADYAYLCDQLRSIRQDMMVQRIQNEFAVEVYETHARIALECRDIAHFNQCQTQLDDLYNAGVKGHHEEFLGYGILYAGLHNMQIELTQILKKLTLKDKQNEAIKHALTVVKALGVHNYRELFKQYKKAPNMAGYLMDLFLDRLKVFALQSISMAYAAGLELEVVAEQLAFDSVDKCKEFIVKAGGKINETGKKLDCKESIKGLRSSSILTKKIT